MSQSLSRWQAVALGLVVVVALVLGGYGVARIADKQGAWAGAVEITAGFTEAHDITPGTPVRLRGVEAGQVVAIEYPDHDGPGAEVTVRMKVRARFADRLYADASAQVHGAGMLGSKVIAIQPGDPRTGPLAGGRLRGAKPFQTDEVIAEVRDLAQEAKGTAAEVKRLAAEARGTVAAAKGLITDVQESTGTLAKLVRDDDLYEETRGALGDLRTLVADGRDTLKSVKQGSDALGKMPIVRGYVEDPVGLLVRPTMSRQRWTFETGHLFEPGTATLTEEGRAHVAAMGSILSANRPSGSDIVVAAFFDARDKSQTPPAARELTKKQAEVVAERLKAAGAHKMGYVTRRKVTPLGMGTGLCPAEPEPEAPSHLRVLLYAPR